MKLHAFMVPKYKTEDTMRFEFPAFARFGAHILLKTKV